MSTAVNLNAALNAVAAAGSLPETTKEQKEKKDYALRTANKWLADATTAHEQEIERKKAEKKREEEAEKRKKR